ncbi:MAG: hypothetical protein AAGM22_26635 [Acidobacteriota bacterium]
MYGWKNWCRGAAAVTLLAQLALANPSAEASTLIRMGQDKLATTNQTVVIARAETAQSYWNADGSLIFTDVTIKVLEVIKGAAAGGEMTVTTVGGTVGDITNLVVGAASLTAGRPYLLFLSPADLPGAPGVLAVRDMAQGAFDIYMNKSGKLIAVSQAGDEHMVPDEFGLTTAPGGSDGLLLDAFVSDLRQAVAQDGSGSKGSGSKGGAR